MAEEILYVESRRAARVKRMQTFQHLFAAVLLATAGFSHFHHNAWLSVGEIATAAVLLASVLEEKLHQHHESRRHVASVELAGSLMSFVEAVERTRGPHHVSFVILTFSAPLVLLIFAIMDARTGERRFIRVDERGIEVRVRRLWRTRVAWSEIPGYKIDGDRVDFGGRVLKLKDVVDRDRARDWLVDVLQRRGIAELPA